MFGELQRGDEDNLAGKVLIYSPVLVPEGKALCITYASVDFSELEGRLQETATETASLQTITRDEEPWYFILDFAPDHVDRVPDADVVYLSEEVLPEYVFGAASAAAFLYMTRFETQQHLRAPPEPPLSESLEEFTQITYETFYGHLPSYLQQQFVAPLWHAKETKNEEQSAILRDAFCTFADSAPFRPQVSALCDAIAEGDVASAKIYYDIICAIDQEDYARAGELQKELKHYG